MRNRNSRPSPNWRSGKHMHTWWAFILTWTVLTCMIQHADTGGRLVNTGPEPSSVKVLLERRHHDMGCQCVLRLSGGEMQWVHEKLSNAFVDTVQKPPDVRPTRANLADQSQGLQTFPQKGGQRAGQRPIVSSWVRKLDAEFVTESSDSEQNEQQEFERAQPGHRDFDNSPLSEIPSERAEAEARPAIAPFDARNMHSAALATTVHASKDTRQGAFLPSLPECRKDPDGVEIQIRRALETQPQNADILCAYASFLLHIRRNATEAERMYAEAISVHPKHVEALCGLGGIFLEENINVSAAECIIGTLLRLEPNNAEALSLHALWLEKAKRDWVGSEEAHRKAAYSGDVSARRLCRLAGLLERAHNDIGGAEGLYKEAGRMFPEDPTVAFEYGRLLYRRTSRREDSEVLLRKCLRIESTHIGALCELAGLLHTAKGDLYQAESLYRAALKALPTHVGSLQGYAALLDDGLKDAQAAIAMCKRALAQDADHVPTLCRYARLLQDTAKDHATAESIYKRVLEMDMECVDALFDYGRLLEEEKGDSLAAERMYRRALQVNSCHVPTLSNLGLLLEETRGDDGGAEEMYIRALAADENDTGTLYNYGVLLQVKRKDIDGAEKLYRKLLECEPDDAAALHVLGNLLLDSHRNEAEAEALLQRALRSTPSDPGLTCDYGRMLQAQGRTLEAEEMYERTLKIDPNHEVALRNYAALLHDKLGESERAEALYKRLLAVGKSAKAKAGVLCKYARLLQEQSKDYDAVERMYNQAMMYGVMDLNAIKSYAVLLDEVRNDHKRASTLFATALESDPSYAQVLFERARSRGGESSEQAMTVLLAFNSSHAAAAWELGRLHNARGDHSKASMWFQRAVKTDPNMAEELFRVGRAHEDAGEVEECRKAYEQVLLSAPWHKECSWRYAGVREDLFGDARSADELFERALEGEGDGLPKNSMMELVERGAKRESKGDMEGAVRVYKMLLRHVGVSDKKAEGTALRRCAVLLHTSLRNYDEAEQMYAHTFKHGASDASSLLSWGMLLEFERSNYTSALEKYKLAEAASPTDARILSAMANLLHRKLKLEDEALAVYKRAIVVCADDDKCGEGDASVQSKLLVGYADLLRESHKDWAGAESAYLSALELREDDQAALLGLVKVVNAQGGDATSTHKILERLVKHDVRDAWVWFEYGKCVLADGGDARTAFLRTLEMQPQHVGALKELAALDAGAGRWDSARQTLENLIQIHPTDIATRVDLANVLVALGERDAIKRAEGLLSGVLCQDPRNIKATLGLARLYAAQGDSSAALRAYSTVLKTHGEIPEARQGARALQKRMVECAIATKGTLLAVQIHAILATFDQHQVWETIARRVHDESLAKCIAFMCSTWQPAAIAARTPARSPAFSALHARIPSLQTPGGTPGGVRVLHPPIKTPLSMPRGESEAGLYERWDMKESAAGMMMEDCGVVIPGVATAGTATAGTATAGTATGVNDALVKELIESLERGEKAKRACIVADVQDQEAAAHEEDIRTEACEEDISTAECEEHLLMQRSTAHDAEASQLHLQSSSPAQTWSFSQSFRSLAQDKAGAGGVPPTPETPETPESLRDEVFAYPKVSRSILTTPLPVPVLRAEDSVLSDLLCSTPTPTCAKSAEQGMNSPISTHTMQDEDHDSDDSTAHQRSEILQSEHHHQPDNIAVAENSKNITIASARSPITVRRLQNGVIDKFRRPRLSASALRVSRSSTPHRSAAAPRSSKPAWPAVCAARTASYTEAELSALRAVHSRYGSSGSMSTSPEDAATGTRKLRMNLQLNSLRSLAQQDEGESNSDSPSAVRKNLNVGISPSGAQHMSPGPRWSLLRDDDVESDSPQKAVSSQDVVESTSESDSSSMEAEENNEREVEEERIEHKISRKVGIDDERVGGVRADRRLLRHEVSDDGDGSSVSSHNTQHKTVVRFAASVVDDDDEQRQVIEEDDDVEFVSSDEESVSVVKTQADARMESTHSSKYDEKQVIEARKLLTKNLFAGEEGEDSGEGVRHTSMQKVCSDDDDDKSMSESYERIGPRSHRKSMLQKVFETESAAREGTSSCTPVAWLNSRRSTPRTQEQNPLQALLISPAASTPGMSQIHDRERVSAAGRESTAESREEHHASDVLLDTSVHSAMRESCSQNEVIGSVSACVGSHAVSCDTPQVRDAKERMLLHSHLENTDSKQACSDMEQDGYEGTPMTLRSSETVHDQRSESYHGERMSPDAQERLMSEDHPISSLRESREFTPTPSKGVSEQNTPISKHTHTDVSAQSCSRPHDTSVSPCTIYASHQATKTPSTILDSREVSESPCKQALLYASREGTVSPDRMYDSPEGKLASWAGAAFSSCSSPCDGQNDNIRDSSHIQNRLAMQEDGASLMSTTHVVHNGIVSGSFEAVMEGNDADGCDTLQRSIEGVHALPCELAVADTMHHLDVQAEARDDDEAVYSSGADSSEQHSQMAENDEEEEIAHAHTHVQAVQDSVFSELVSSGKGVVGLLFIEARRLTGWMAVLLTASTPPSEVDLTLQADSVHAGHSFTAHTATTRSEVIPALEHVEVLMQDEDGAIDEEDSHVSKGQREAHACQEETDMHVKREQLRSVVDNTREDSHVSRGLLLEADAADHKPEMEADINMKLEQICSVVDTHEDSHTSKGALLEAHASQEEADIHMQHEEIHEDKEAVRSIAEQKQVHSSHDEHMVKGVSAGKVQGPQGFMGVLSGAMQRAKSMILPWVRAEDSNPVPRPETVIDTYEQAGLNATTSAAVGDSKNASKAGLGVHILNGEAVVEYTVMRGVAFRTAYSRSEKYMVLDEAGRKLGVRQGERIVATLPDQRGFVRVRDDRWKRVKEELLLPVKTVTGDALLVESRVMKPVEHTPQRPEHTVHPKGVMMCDAESKSVHAGRQLDFVAQEQMQSIHPTPLEHDSVQKSGIDARTVCDEEHRQLGIDRSVHDGDAHHAAQTATSSAKSEETTPHMVKDAAIAHTMIPIHGVQEQEESGMKSGMIESRKTERMNIEGRKAGGEHTDELNDSGDCDEAQLARSSAQQMECDVLDADAGMKEEAREESVCEARERANKVVLEQQQQQENAHVDEESVSTAHDVCADDIPTSPLPQSRDYAEYTGQIDARAASPTAVEEEQTPTRVGLRRVDHKRTFSAELEMPTPVGLPLVDDKRTTAYPIKSGVQTRVSFDEDISHMESDVAVKCDANGREDDSNVDTKHSNVADKYSNVDEEEHANGKSGLHSRVQIMHDVQASDEDIHMLSMQTPVRATSHSPSRSTLHYDTSKAHASEIDAHESSVESRVRATPIAKRSPLAGEIQNVDDGISVVPSAHVQQQQDGEVSEHDGYDVRSESVGEQHQGVARMYASHVNEQERIITHAHSVNEKELIRTYASLDDEGHTRAHATLNEQERTRAHATLNEEERTRTYASLNDEERTKRSERCDVANNLADEGNLDAAVCLYEELLEEVHDDADVLTSYGQAMYGTPKAGELFRRALDSDPANAIAACGMGDFLSETGDAEDEELIALDLLQVGDAEGARKMYDLALSTDPSNPSTLNNYGMLLQHKFQDYSGSMQMYKRALLADPTSSSAYHNLGFLLHDVLSDLDGAEEMYKRALELEPDSIETLFNLARAKEIRGHDWELLEVRDLYERVLQLSPDHTEAYDALIEVRAVIRTKNLDSPMARNSVRHADSHAEKSREAERVDEQESVVQGDYKQVVSDGRIDSHSVLVAASAAAAAVRDSDWDIDHTHARIMVDGDETARATSYLSAAEQSHETYDDGDRKPRFHAKTSKPEFDQNPKSELYANSKSEIDENNKSGLYANSKTEIDENNKSGLYANSKSEFDQNTKLGAGGVYADDVQSNNADITLQLTGLGGQDSEGKDGERKRSMMMRSPESIAQSSVPRWRMHGEAKRRERRERARRREDWDEGSGALDGLFWEGGASPAGLRGPSEVVIAKAAHARRPSHVKPPTSTSKIMRSGRPSGPVAHPQTARRSVSHARDRAHSGAGKTLTHGSLGVGMRRDERVGAGADVIPGANKAFFADVYSSDEEEEDVYDDDTSSQDDRHEKAHTSVVHPASYQQNTRQNTGSLERGEAVDVLGRVRGKRMRDDEEGLNEGEDVRGVYAQRKILRR